VDIILQILIIFMAALAPCVFWLWLIYRWDKYRPEPRSLIIRTFILGMVVAIPVALIESFLYPQAAEGPATLQSAAYIAFVVAGITEEAGKFIVVRAGAYRSEHFEEPADGLVYSATAALGFASLENVVYILTFGLPVILIRGLFSNLAHVLFSSLWGYPLALGKLGMMQKRGTYIGLALAMFAHGLFDFFFYTESLLTFLAIPLFLGMAAMFVLMMRHANRHAVYVEHRFNRRPR
jgi:RsiW-degrading membrane proteinase PrsW (M82 family)